MYLEIYLSTYSKTKPDAVLNAITANIANIIAGGIGIKPNLLIFMEINTIMKRQKPEPKE